MQFHEDILKISKENSFFRKVLATGQHSQVVVMSIPPKGEIGNEVHEGVDQVLVCVEGEGEVVLDNKEVSAFLPGTLTFVPAGTWHNFLNTGNYDLKIFTIYSPPQHAPGTVHKTKAEADEAERAENK